VPAAEHGPTTSTTVMDGPSPTPTTTNQDQGEVVVEGEVVSYGPPWAHYLGGYQDRLLGGPLGLPDLRCMAPDGVKHKDCRGEVLG
jgi:hypothetical protein